MIKPVLFIDFETEAIGNRPHVYPPKPVGFAYKFKGKKDYVSWGHPGKNSHTYKEARLLFLELCRDSSAVVAHNAQFDKDVCETWLEIEGLNWFCTMAMAFLNNPYGELRLKPLSEEVLGMPPEEQDDLHDWIMANVPEATKKTAGAYICRAPASIVKPYAIGDVVRCEGLYNKWKATTKEEAFLREMRLLGPILDMERHGVRLDVKALQRDTDLGYAELDKLDTYLSNKLGGNVDMDNDGEVAAALNTKPSMLKAPLPLTEKGAVSVSKKALIASIKNKEFLGRLLLRNALTTCLRTFMTPWLLQARDNKGRLYFKFSPIRSEYGIGARTGRLSSSPNMMNLPSEFEALLATFKDIGFTYPYMIPNLRQYVLPDEGHVIISADYSQIEMRVFAHFEDGALMNAYAKNPKIDAHTMVAELANVTRKVAKTLNFAALYGAGLGVIMQQLDCTHDEARHFKRLYKFAFPGVDDLNKSIRATLAQGDPLWTVGGRRYVCEEPKYIKGVLRTFEYKMINYLCQGSAADIMKEAMILYFANIYRKGRPMFVVHDELVVSVPKANAAREALVIKDCMEAALLHALDVKLLVETGIGNNYANC